MLDRVRAAPGRLLDAAAYLDDFWPRFGRLGDEPFWKLERAQHFREPDVASWSAMVAGDWERSLVLVEEMRADIASASGPELRRVRIVEQPVTPYLQWEMQILRLRAEAGERIRVLPAKSVAHLEASGTRLPEVVLLGSLAMYEVLYDRTGTLSGARRIDDPDLLGSCRAELSRLYDQGEDLLNYFDREIIPLPPPKPGA
ncbi:hypothetical protein HS041_14395 [Planomonospora sp. ID67723]|uniref:DUF6879 family protein n=1 Tax=Planomonospora sp. ID67723 TaxID=2738134 RepID=UPI0018C419F4|nr:DUF6879 family protein [Planomonospora sp. ID67723]MBG0828961.1 hypothetical protein [Planomonospora sp. ID67723]